MAQVELKDVSHSYGRGTVVSGVSFTLYTHEFLSIVGPSGCGKSTILRLIAGIIPEPMLGDIYIGGVLQNGIPTHKRNTSLLFQSLPLFEHRTVGENIALPVKWMSGVSAISRAKEVAAFFRVEDLLDRYPGSLSGGQRQRVALARVLSRKPQVLLLDEPFSSLDAHLRDMLRRELKMLLKEYGTTVVFVTHDQHEAFAFGDRVAVMSGQGVVEQIGAPSEVYESPINTAVASFVGSSEVLPLGIIRDVSGVLVPERAHTVCIRPRMLALKRDESSAWQVVSLECLGPCSQAVVRHMSNGHELLVAFSNGEALGVGERIGLSAREQPFFFDSSGTRL